VTQALLTTNPRYIEGDTNEIFNAMDELFTVRLHRHEVFTAG
jgi:hypothetical protein